MNRSDANAEAVAQELAPYFAPCSVNRSSTSSRNIDGSTMQIRDRKGGRCGISQDVEINGPVFIEDTGRKVSDEILAANTREVSTDASTK